MIKVGVTGGIGCGKTLVCKVFSELGVPVYEADKEAKKLLHTNENIKKSIIKTFGAAIYSHNTLQKDKLAAIVFSDKKALADLNSIVHPEVFKDFNRWAQVQRHNNCNYVIQEAAILFESGADKLMDYSVTINAPLEVRLERIKKRDNISEEQIKERMNNQWTDEQRNGKADYSLINDDSKLLLPQILELHRLLQEKAQQ